MGKRRKKACPKQGGCAGFHRIANQKDTGINPGKMRREEEMIKSGSRELNRSAAKFLSAVSLSVLAVGTAHAQSTAAQDAAAEEAPAAEEATEEKAEG